MSPLYAPRHKNQVIGEADSHVPWINGIASMDHWRRVAITATAKTDALSRNSDCKFALPPCRTDFWHTGDKCFAVATSCEVWCWCMWYFECVYACLSTTIDTYHSVPLACRCHNVSGSVCASARRRHLLATTKSRPGGVLLVSAPCHSLSHVGRATAGILPDAREPQLGASTNVVYVVTRCTVYPPGDESPAALHNNRLPTWLHYHISCLPTLANAP